MEKKYYYYFGYEIVRTKHYVDAHKHYDYVITDMKMARGRIFDSLSEAKKFIKNELYASNND